MKTFYSHGKLLLSGEYVVLDGALALAAPTHAGQWLEIRDAETDGLHWRSLGPGGVSWFDTHYRPEELQAPPLQDVLPSDLRGRLRYLLATICSLKPDFADQIRHTAVETRLEFPREWGLGSSSTLISNLAFWADINPFLLLKKTFGGSGYDIAAAREDAPFLYRLGPEGNPEVESIAFTPPFAHALFFVYLNQKQDSREGISQYRNRPIDREAAVNRISGLTQQMIASTDLDSFCEIMEAHEAYIAEVLQIQPVKERLFPDFPGSVKSLGAWGGDFILATGRASHQEYFRKKGYPVVKPYREMIL
jgi:hypothetical protein